MLVYRYEHKETGRGPYHSGNEDISEALADHNGSNRHPLPFDDGLNLDNCDLFFGFDSFEKLEEWFDGIHEILYFHGFFVSVYEVDIAHIQFSKSGRQVAFEKSFSELVESLDFIPE